jgi:hypothetical protein
MHGYAHHEAAHLEYGHHNLWATADHGETTVSAPERQHDHPHPNVGRALGARQTHAHFAPLLPPAVASGFEPKVIVRARLIVAAARARADPAHAASLRSRAPPLPLG